MGKWYCPEDEVRDLEPPSKDTTDRHEADAFLRSQGYEIASRPRVGPNLWRLKRNKKRVFTEAVALRRCGRDSG